VKPRGPIFHEYFIELGPRKIFDEYFIGLGPRKADKIPIMRVKEQIKVISITRIRHRTGGCYCCECEGMGETSEVNNASTSKSLSIDRKKDFGDRCRFHKN
jgi:hypothetical protein